MNCPRCNKECKQHEEDKVLIHYCDNCWDYITSDFRKCSNHNLIFVKFYNSNKTIHLRKQCFTCGKIEGKCYSKSSVPDLDSIVDADLTLNSDYWSYNFHKVNEIYARYSIKKKEFEKQKSLVQFLDEHTEYLKTELWQSKRLKVLERDNFICQSCNKEKAVEVHHKTYRYWKNEPLYDLVSVCLRCHEIITMINRANEEDKEKIEKI